MAAKFQTTLSNSFSRNKLLAISNFSRIYLEGSNSQKAYTASHDFFDWLTFGHIEQFAIVTPYRPMRPMEYSFLNLPAVDCEKKNRHRQKQGSILKIIFK